MIFCGLLSFSFVKKGIVYAMKNGKTWHLVADEMEAFAWGAGEGEEERVR